MKIEIKNFTGEYPSTYHELLQYNYASQSTNANTSRGIISAFRTDRFVKKLQKDTKYVLFDEGVLKEFNSKDISYARTQTIITYKIITGLKKYPVICYEEGQEKTFYRLGIPKPVSAPTTSSIPSVNIGLGGTKLKANPQDSLSETIDARCYVYTYVNELGEEGPPSDPSPVVKVKDGATVGVSGIRRAENEYNIKKIRLYRASSSHININNASNANSCYRLVNEFSASSGQLSDNVSNINLGDILDSEDVCMPPDELRDIVAINNSIFAGIVGDNIIMFSSPNEPFNWNIKYSVAIDEKILRIYPYQHYLIVFTKSKNIVINTNFSENGDCQKIEFNDNLTLANKKIKNSIIDTNLGVCFVSNRGLVINNASSQQIITIDFFSPDDFKKLLPDQMLLGFYEGIIYFSSPKITYQLAIGGQTINNKNQVYLTEITTIGDGNLKNRLDYIIPTNNALYFIINSDVYQFNCGTTFRPYCWKSKKFSLNENVNFAGCLVRTGYEIGKLQFELIGNNGNIIYCKNIVCNERFRLPSGRVDNEFYIKLTGTKSVYSIILSTSFKDLL